MLSSRNKGSVNLALTRAGGGVRMTDGTEVRIRGRLDWYAPRGQLQLRMTAIDPAYTLGQLELLRAQLLQRLEAEGLLRANAAHPLPLVPLRVGVVTSSGSAAEADFVDELRRSGFAFDVRRVDARVQGPDAAYDIVSGIERAVADGAEVIALVRGGGARTDLAAFDDERIARAIATCPVPVLTGIGHEVDRSVADDVAHTAHKTPTACAHALVLRVRAFVDAIDGRWLAIATLARRGPRATTPRSWRPPVPGSDVPPPRGWPRPPTDTTAGGNGSAGPPPATSATPMPARWSGLGGSPCGRRGRSPRPTGPWRRSRRGSAPSTPTGRSPAAGPSPAPPMGGSCARPTRSPPATSC